MFFEYLFLVYLEVLDVFSLDSYCCNLPRYNNPFSLLSNSSLVYAVKLTTSLLFLIFIRAGLPRYRYDYLTILGWSQFLVYNLFIFIFLFIIYILF